MSATLAPRKPVITASSGITTGMGFVAGGGYTYTAADLRARLDAAADELAKLFSNDVEKRANSDAKSGGAFLVTVPSRTTTFNAEVGINVNHNSDDFRTYVKVVALREDSPLRPDLTGYTFDASRTSLYNDPMYATIPPFSGTLPEVLAYLGQHVRPAAEITTHIAADLEAVNAYQAANSWWVSRMEHDGRRLLALARRHPSAKWHDSTVEREALTAYCESSPAMAGQSVRAAEVTTDGLRRYFDLPDLDAAMLEPGRVYEVIAGRLVPTKYASKKVATLSESVLDAA